MPGNLAGLRTGPRFMPQVQSANLKRGQPLAGGISRNAGIVIAGNPDPIASGLQRAERGMIDSGPALSAAIVMKAVPECDDTARRLERDEYRQSRQRRAGVVRRQHHAALGV